jgi:rhodanese-related sulfurtransferase
MAVSEIDVQELAARLAAGAVVVDVREDHEWDEGHIAGAVHVPLATVPDHLDAFRSATPVHVICKAGGRSLRAAEYVDGLGIEAVNVAGGMLAWERAGYPVETGPA